MTPEQINDELREIHETFCLITYATDIGNYLRGKLGSTLVNSTFARKAKDVERKNPAALIQLYSEIASECGIVLPPQQPDMEYEMAVEADKKYREMK